MRHTFTAPLSGQLLVTLTWANPEVDLDLYVTASSCTQPHPRGACQILGASDLSTGTREEVERSVSSGDALAVFVDSLGLVATSYEVDIQIR